MSFVRTVRVCWRVRYPAREADAVCDSVFVYQTHFSLPFFTELILSLDQSLAAVEQASPMLDTWQWCQCLLHGDGVCIAIAMAMAMMHTLSIPFKWQWCMHRQSCLHGNGARIVNDLDMAMVHASPMPIT